MGELGSSVETVLMICMFAVPLIAVLSAVKTGSDISERKFYKDSRRRACAVMLLSLPALVSLALAWTALPTVVMYILLLVSALPLLVAMIAHVVACRRNNAEVPMIIWVCLIFLILSLILYTLCFAVSH